jgi:hypothetical protein
MILCGQGQFIASQSARNAARNDKRIFHTGQIFLQLIGRPNATTISTFSRHTHVVRQWATDNRAMTTTTPMFLDAKSTAYNDEWLGSAQRVTVSRHKVDPWRDLLTSQRTKLNTIIASSDRKRVLIMSL